MLSQCKNKTSFYFHEKIGAGTKYPVELGYSPLFQRSWGKSYLFGGVGVSANYVGEFIVEVFFIVYEVAFILKHMR